MGGDAPEVFEFAKEAFDKVTLLVKPRREADRTFAQSFGRDIGQAAAIRDIISEPVGIISFVAKHHSAGLDISKQFSGAWMSCVLPGVITNLTGKPCPLVRPWIFLVRSAPASS